MQYNSTINVDNLKTIINKNFFINIIIKAEILIDDKKVKGLRVRTMGLQTYLNIYMMLPTEQYFDLILIPAREVWILTG